MLTKTSAITFVAGGTKAFHATGAVGLICEVAPDGSLSGLFPGAVTLRELIGDPEEAKLRAYQLARGLLDGEPAIRGVQQLGVFEEEVIRWAQRAFHTLHLLDWLDEMKIGTCRFDVPSWLAGAVSEMAPHRGISVEVWSPRSWPGAGQLGRVWRRLRESAFSWRAAREEWHQVLDRVDPYRRHNALSRRRTGWTAGETWFYSTASTFTQIGLAYEPYFPRPFRFLVENKATGGAPLEADTRPSVSIYEFSSSRMAPSRGEIESARQAIRHHVENAQLSGQNRHARKLVLTSPFFDEFCRRLLPRGLFQTALFEEWAERASPKALVVGNPVFERYALLAARKRGIPTVLLQHGVLGDFCQFSDPPVDRYIVRGKFWREFLAEAPRRRASILNIPNSRRIESLKDRRRSILFLTAPYSMQALWVDSDLNDITGTLLRCADKADAELIIRVHPLERVGFYRNHLNKLRKKQAGSALITYSRGGTLEYLLRRSAVAVMFSSTAFLECLRFNVPIVSFDWHHFSFKQQIARDGPFQFARSHAELSNLVFHALSGDLPPLQQSLGPFLASTSEQELRSELRVYVQSPGSDDR